MKKLSIFLMLLISMAYISGCRAYSDLKANPKPDTTLETTVPDDWQITTSDQASDVVQSSWLSSFADPKLDIIATQVLAYNYDIQAAAARVDAAQAAARKAGSALLPVVNANIGTQRQGHLKSSQNSSRTIGASLDVSWELDVWGRIATSSDAASDNLTASKADMAYARQSLIAQATKSYLLAIEASQQQEYAKQVYDNFAQNLKVAQAFAREGAASAQDVALAKSELARAQDFYEDAKNAKLQASRSLELLMGKYPSGEFEVAIQLPAYPPRVSAGLPSELLERRPDLVAAERRVAAAFKRTSSTRTARLPRISLTGSLGGSSDALADIANPTNIFWNLSSNLIAPIFDGESRKADVEIATAEQDEALAYYKKAALAAFADVENALSNEQALLKRLKALEDAYTQALIAEKIADAKYQQGDGQLLDVLQVKRSTISANIERLHVQQQLISERVNLYLALGGDV